MTINLTKSIVSASWGDGYVKKYCIKDKGQHIVDSKYLQDNNFVTVSEDPVVPIVPTTTTTTSNQGKITNVVTPHYYIATPKKGENLKTIESVLFKFYDKTGNLSTIDVIKNSSSELNDHVVTATYSDKIMLKPLSIYALGRYVGEIEGRYLTYIDNQLKNPYYISTKTLFGEKFHIFVCSIFERSGILSTKKYYSIVILSQEEFKKYDFKEVTKKKSELLEQGGSKRKSRKSKKSKRRSRKNKRR